MKRHNVKNQKGAVTLLVLVTILFFVAVLMSLYILIANKAQTQIEIARGVQRIYQAEDPRDVYDSFFGEEVVPIYNIDQLFAIGTEVYMPITELGGKMYYFSKGSTYILMNDLKFDYTDAPDMPSEASWLPIGNRYEGKYLENLINPEDILGEVQGRFEGNGKKIIVTGNSEWGSSYEFNSNNDYMYVESLLTYTADGVPVPRGFYYVGGTLDTGVVISDNQADENKGDSHLVAQTLEGNQFVWVPVSNPEDMYVANGISQGNHVGQLYTFSGAISTKSIPAYTANSGFREPDIVTWDNNGTGTEFDGLVSYLQTAGVNTGGLTNGASAATYFKNQLQTEFNAMIESVKKYNGFYIGRYETGDLSKTTVVSEKGNTDIDNQNWYTMYKKQKELYKNSNIVVSSMIWGCQWDATLRWFQSTGSATYVTNSTGKGNYNGTIAATGSNENYKVGNIYDMAGNIHDSTLESYNTMLRVTRGRILPKYWCF